MVNVQSITTCEKNGDVTTVYVFKNGYTVKTEKCKAVDGIFLTLYFKNEKTKLRTEKFEFKDFNLASDEQELNEMLNSVGEYKPITPQNCRTCKKVVTTVDFDTGLYTLMCSERKDVNISQEDIQCKSWEYYRY